MREVRTEVEIRATPDQVWKILVEFDSYPSWNPFLRVAGGPLAVGAPLSVTVLPEGGFSTTFRAIVELATAPKELGWVGRLGVPGLFDGRHRFELTEVAPGRTRLVQRETFRGLLVSLAFYFGVGDATRAGFDRMNESLRQRAEPSSSAAAPGT